MRALTQPAPPIGSFQTVDGRRVFADKQGGGDGALVFLPGAGLTGLDYHELHTRAARSRTSVIYDRTGTGWSERTGRTPSAAEVTDELRSLLAALDVAAPVVLAGHSLGGLYARHYAKRFPQAVAGLVLLDPAHEDYDAAMPPELTEQRSGAWVYDAMNTILDIAMRTPPTQALLDLLPPVKRYQRLYRELFEKEMTSWPPAIRDALIERHTSLDWLAVGLRESRGVEALYNDVRAAGPTPDLPTVILTSTGSDGFRDAVSSGESPALLRAEVGAKRVLYERVAGESSHGEVRSVDTGHVTLPFRAADEIIGAIDDVVT